MKYYLEKSTNRVFTTDGKNYITLRFFRNDYELRNYCNKERLVLNILYRLVLKLL